MAAQFDPSEFVDDDFQSGQQGVATSPAVSAATGGGQRAPTREELESRVGEMQHKLSDLKRAQQELERERAELEETRRRQTEFTKGRQEMEQHLTRGIGLLEEAEFSARRDAEQTGKALVDLREALLKVQAIHEEIWTKDNFNSELTRALTTIENARMEWNSARLKFTLLNGENAAPAGGPGPDPAAAANPFETLLRERNYGEICKLGLALTWPIAVSALAIFLVLLFRR